MKESVAFIVHNCKQGGSVGAVAWRQIVELSRYVCVYVITADLPEVPNKNVIPKIIKPFKWNFLRRFCHLPNEFSFQSAARTALIGLIKENRIGSVWCHSHGTVARISDVCRQHHLKIIMTTHGDIYERPLGTYNRQLTWYYRAVTPKAYKYADCVQALSPYMAEWAIKNGADSGKVRIVPNGITAEDIGAFHIKPRKAETFISQKVFNVLYVGELLSHKGVDLLLQAINILALSGMPIRVICVGDGPEKSNLKRMAEDFNLEEVVAFVGRVTKKQLHKYYSNADILCVPSTSDPLPTVVLESFVMGLPVVGADTGGIPFMVENGKNGYLFETGNVKSLVERLMLAVKDKERLSVMSENCVVSAKNRFSWDRVGRQLYRLVPQNKE